MVEISHGAADAGNRERKLEIGIGGKQGDQAGNEKRQPYRLRVITVLARVLLSVQRI
jgi:hypothetical protein